MDTFGKKLRECRETKNLSKKDLAALLNTSYSVIGKYERDEMIPFIELAKNIARILETTVGYILGETEQVNIFKDPAVLNRFNDIEKLDPENKKHLLSVVDGFIRALKFKNIASL
ncbi:helix-turn-helix domain-containing protein [Chryseobacterium sp. BIGb0232]|uniref:helix-turn-helix domain-containing protein n=1 Tax=Chryseobacterium sp. BIGb0232 TaxID=2940598 RepID=UPI000F4A737D|nr:helix-turn-helix transcriptional regulator [Chryseobacterium sp. BIGb0232]MCS4300657.1 transcriptional regulator with XRE-family HTH domain [Chryseobacterium sp. BIGb0232]ROS20460.1 helix-turn-helix protein [Chryseobacterium nakagawai]